MMHMLIDPYGDGGHGDAVGDKKFGTLLDLCVSSLRRGHANLLCIVPILTDDPRKESEGGRASHPKISERLFRSGLFASDAFRRRAAPPTGRAASARHSAQTAPRRERPPAQPQTDRTNLHQHPRSISREIGWGPKAPQKFRKSHCCVPFTATFSKRRKIGAI